jgi:Carboxypeptidase regulatory-like domain/TonB dependent receptor-like, beta-barrel
VSNHTPFIGRGVRLYLRLCMAAAVLAATSLLPADVMAQTLYGSVTGNVADGSGAAVPGANVSIRNEATGLELTAVTDETGTYTIRNVTGGTYTLRATLQGFKEFVQTGIPVTAGGIVRINGRLEVGALSESVTVTTEVAVLKTDKADVSVDLKPADVVNLPLNQYRNYQYLMNLVPGATPPVFQNAQTDTPGRALSTNINGTNRNNNVTRIDGAASINVWLPHHAGYIAPVETIESVNISTNSFDAAQGMTGGAATAVQTKSGTNTVKGSAFYFRQQDEFNARRGYFDPSKVDSSTAILGGTVGGPIRRNKLFYFGSWERNSERQGNFSTYTVPTAKMRAGDFSEVLALNPSFRIYDPATGTSDGRNRTFFPGAVIPSDRISEIAREIQSVYPEPNNPGTNNGLQNNLFLPRQPKADRDNYDGKVNWNRTPQHQIWGKFSMMQAEVFDLFYLGLDGAGGGKTNTKIYTAGQTWTLSPTLLFDANAGANIQKQHMEGPDFGTNFGTDVWGIPGLNGIGATGPGSFDLNRYSGMPNVQTGLSQVGNSDTWTPVWRDERSYTVSTNLTKVSGRHDLRTGFDFIRLRLNHWQPEVSNPRGALTFNTGVTGTPGYAGVGGWNAYAGFLLGQIGSYTKSVQFEELSGRENQFGVYVADRWQASPKLTLNLGLRYEYYPLMSRQNRGIELLDYNTFNVKLGGLGGNPQDLGLEVSKTLFAPRFGAAYRLNDQTVFRAGYGKTFDPLPWSRPMRGRFPLTIAYSDAGLNGFLPYGTLANGIPTAPNPDINSGTVPLPRGVDMTSPDPDNVARGATQSWNVFVERRLPLDISASVGYVGTRTDGTYTVRNLNYAESGGNSNRLLFAQAGNATINTLAGNSRSRYQSLQVAVNRPYKAGLLLKGAYTFSKAMNDVDDDAGAFMWNQASQFSRNYALASYDRPHMLQMGVVYELPFAREGTSLFARLVQGWQVNSIASWLSGNPFSIGGDNGLLQQAGGFQSINVTGSPEPGFGKAGPDEPWYDPSAFSQPGNGWGNTGRNQFRAPSNWNVDMSLFRTIPFGHYRLEIRAESQNVFNHTQWGAPITSFTDPNFMRIRTLARAPRTVQLGTRLVF